MASSISADSYNPSRDDFAAMLDESFAGGNLQESSVIKGKVVAIARGEQADEAAVLADIIRRDERDKNRPIAPLKPAPDASWLDNSQLDIEGGVRAAIDIIEAVRAGRSRG